MICLECIICGEELASYTFLDRDHYTKIKRYTCNTYNMQHLPIQIQIEHFKNIKIQTTGSTSHAAKLTSEFPEMAAIASRESAKKYSLDILANDIQDYKENYTRFVVLGNNIPEPTRHDKTSIIIHLAYDRPGALYDLLGEFASRNINLTKIESRPSKMGLGDYLFYIDMEGHRSDRDISVALNNIEKIVDWLKIIGSYPLGIKII